MKRIPIYIVYFPNIFCAHSNSPLPQPHTQISIYLFSIYYTNNMSLFFFTPIYIILLQQVSTFFHKVIEWITDNLGKRNKKIAACTYTYMYIYRYSYIITRIYSGISLIVKYSTYQQALTQLLIDGNLYAEVYLPNIGWPKKNSIKNLIFVKYIPIPNIHIIKCTIYVV